MIQFNNLPKDKPSQNNVKPGRYTATVFKCEMRTGKDTGTEYLNVSFLLDGGGFVNENYFDSDKQFLQFKLGQLLKACKVTLEGEGTLKDVAKVIKGKKVIVDVVVNDKGYGALDYTGNNDGIYPVDTPSVSETDVETPEVLDEDLNQAIDDDF
jgi:hypothetical protein